MDLWTEETWKYKTQSTTGSSAGYVKLELLDRLFRYSPASPDGRAKGKFLSNAIALPRRDTNGPTANVNSVGKVLG